MLRNIIKKMPYVIAKTCTRYPRKNNLTSEDFMEKMLRPYKDIME